MKLVFRRQSVNYCYFFGVKIEEIGICPFNILLASTIFCLFMFCCSDFRHVVAIKSLDLSFVYFSIFSSNAALLVLLQIAASYLNREKNNKNKASYLSRVKNNKNKSEVKHVTWMAPKALRCDGH